MNQVWERYLPRQLKDFSPSFVFIRFFFPLLSDERVGPFQSLFQALSGSRRFCSAIATNALMKPHRDVLLCQLYSTMETMMYIVKGCVNSCLDDEGTARWTVVPVFGILRACSLTDGWT